MAFFDDMTAAIETYPESDVEIEITDVVIPGSVLNVNEVGSFRVRVTNTGPLNLDGVTLKVKGRNGATVANNGAAAPFVSEFVTQALPRINGHGGSQLTVGSPLKFKAPANSSTTAKELVKVTLEAWDAELSHIMIGHSDPLATVKDSYTTTVSPL